nr:MAG TPA: hypothetical protein [Caudoviricetes sp.]DAW31948.1 MAG TPA: hypothetical protein [Caudoviricetes sp.]DAZ38307.1 MAG TPA: hypothetical protein [Caudoviricetes sp.]
MSKSTDATRTGISIVNLIRSWTYFNVIYYRICRSRIIIFIEDTYNSTTSKVFSI